MNKNLKELAKKHFDFSVEEERKSDVKMMRDMLEERAEEIYRAIEKDIGSKDGLFYFKSGDIERYAHSTALMAVLSKVIGNDEAPERLYGEIVNKVGKRKWLYNLGYMDDRKKSMIKTTEVNASMAILAKLLGKDEEAEKIYMRVGKMVGKDDGLYCLSTRSAGVNFEGSALMGAAARLLGKDEEAEIIYEKIKKKVELNGGLYDDGWGAETYGNAAMAVFLELMGKENEAKKIAENLEEQMLNGTLFSEDKELGYPVTHSNALMGIYYCLRAGKKLS